MCRMFPNPLTVPTLISVGQCSTWDGRNELAQLVKRGLRWVIRMMKVSVVGYIPNYQVFSAISSSTVEEGGGYIIRTMKPQLRCTTCVESLSCMNPPFSLRIPWLCAQCSPTWPIARCHLWRPRTEVAHNTHPRQYMTPFNWRKRFFVMLFVALNWTHQPAYISWTLVVG